MNCKRARRQLNAFDLDALSPEDSASVAGHLRSCAACRAELQKLRAITEALGVLPQAEPPADLWPAVKSRLRPRRRALGWLADAWQPAVTVAAAVLLALVLLRGSVAPVFTTPQPAIIVAEAQPPDEQLVAIGWQRPFADDAALGAQLVLYADGGDSP